MPPCLEEMEAEMMQAKAVLLLDSDPQHSASPQATVCRLLKLVVRCNIVRGLRFMQMIMFGTLHIAI